KIKPDTYTFNPPRGKIVDHEIHLTYVRTDQDADSLKREYQKDVESIKQYLEWQRQSVTPHNSQIPTLVQAEVTNRKQALLGNSKMVESLGLPMKRRAGVPATFAVPVHRQKPRIERPATIPATKPEPALSMDNYETILSIAKNMVAVMERSPKA